MTTPDQTYIYFVTVFYIPREYLNTDDLLKRKPSDKPDDWQTLLYKRIRCWGWYHNMEDAVRCIKENWTDIYENGYYNFAMIETMGEGIAQSCPRSTRYFTAEFIDQDTYNVNEIECPLIFKSLTGFSYA